MGVTILVLLCGLAVISEATVPIPDYVKFVNLNDVEDLARTSDPRFRLPKDVIPIEYQVFLTPYFNTNDEKAFTFTGFTSIVIQSLVANVQQVVLHGSNFTNMEATLTQTSTPGSPNLALGASIDSVTDFLTIPVSVPLIVGTNYTISLSYTGLIQGDHLMRGFYRSWFKDANNNIRWMGTTQFQPGHARRAFPCWDEPSFKAVFIITINRLRFGFGPTISNMPIEVSNEILVDGEERMSDKFYQTPKMSTYLIAFIVTDYVAHNGTTGEERNFAVYGRENARPQGQYAFDVGIQLLDEMEAYTNLSYYSMGNRMKMHQAAIPDFSAGAMENWGLLTYREALILNDDSMTSSLYKQRIANIISHEIAHMWFGNLVTCDWWNNLWLNEGFARYFQYFLTDMVEVEMDFPVKYVVEQVTTALFSDSILNAHALTHDATNSPTEVSAMFSNLSYNKGSAIIRMIEHLLGYDTFVKGLRYYLKERAYGTAVPSDLYKALDEAAIEDDAMSRFGVTVASVMSSWVSKSGYPVIHVAVNQTSGQMRVSQERFLRSPSTTTPTDIYMVPLTFANENAPDWSNTNVDYILTVKQNTYAKGTDQEGWVIFNKRGTGFYRVNYDEDNWERIIQTLNNSITINNVDPLNRALIVDDLFQFARAELITYVTLFRYLSFLEFETSYPVWINALQGFAFLQRRVAHIPVVLQLLNEFILNSMVRVISELGFDERPTDTHLEKLLRMQIMGTACALGHEECIAAATTKFAAFIRPQNPEEVPANLRTWVFCNALRDGRPEDYNILWNRFQSSNIYNEKIEILQILGCTTDPELLERFLTSIFEVDTESGIRAQDVTTALSSALTGNENNTDVVFGWLREHYPSVIANYYGLNGVVTITNSLAGRMIYERQILQLEDWAADTTDLLPIQNSLAAAIASARANMQWTVARIDDIFEALDDSAAGVTISVVLLMLSLMFTLFY